VVIERLAHPTFDVSQAGIDGAQVAHEVVGQFLVRPFASRRPDRAQHRRR
jgi:hypothetical protein